MLGVATAICSLATPQKANCKLSILTLIRGRTTICTESVTEQTPGVLYRIVWIPGPDVSGSNVPNVPSIIPRPLQTPSIVVAEE